MCQYPPQDYFFSVDAALRRIGDEPRDARNPRGARFQVVFQNGSNPSVITVPAAFKAAWGYDYKPFLFETYKDRDDETQKRVIVPEKAFERPWNGLEGSILGGGDFFLVRSDGVLELDGRVTLRADPDDTLIDIVYRGVVDLARYAKNIDLPQARSIEDAEKRRLATEARVSEAFERFINGSLELEGEQADPELPVMLTATCELATGPWSEVEGEDTSWVKDRYLRLQEYVWRYEVLTRQQFVGRGKLVFAPFQVGRLPNAQRIIMDFTALDARQGGAR